MWSNVKWLLVGSYSTLLTTSTLASHYAKSGPQPCPSVVSTILTQSHINQSILQHISTSYLWFTLLLQIISLCLICIQASGIMKLSTPVSTTYNYMYGVVKVSTAQAYIDSVSSFSDQKSNKKRFNRKHDIPRASSVDSNLHYCLQGRGCVSMSTCTCACFC